MQSTQHSQPEASVSGILTTFGATIGLAFGPSVISTLTSGLYIPPIEKEFGWSRTQVALAPGAFLMLWGTYLPLRLGFR